MRKHELLAGAAALLILAFAGRHVLRAQETPEDPPKKRYGDTPEKMVPFGGVGEPYFRLYTDPPDFRGPGRDAPPPEDVDEVRLGILAPMEGPDVAAGKRMLQGVTLAIEEANAAGGFRSGVPYRGIVRDEAQAWGAAANAAVDLCFEDGVWAIIGGFSDEASHVLTRVLLKIEMPCMNTGGSDPTLTEHAIPWLVRMRPDDRQNGYRLARRVFEEDGHRRVVVFRTNDRYSRMGVKEFVDAARRLGHPILLALRYGPHESDWTARMERIRKVRPDAIVVWGSAAPTGRAVKALRDAGLDQPVYGPDRLMDPEFLAAAGKAAEGTRFTHPFGPTRDAKRWEAFRTRYVARFRDEPDAVAAWAYDGTRYLLDAIETAGLNRPLIRDALFARDRYAGVAGEVRFDSTHNNVAPMYVGRVRGGAFLLE